MMTPTDGWNPGECPGSIPKSPFSTPEATPPLDTHAESDTFPFPFAPAIGSPLGR